MNITSYNITDVGYHYIGLRALASLPSDAQRELQVTSISRNILKYASDKALRLMLPAPRGDFGTVGEKVCQELAHLRLADSAYGKGYCLTEAGVNLLQLLNSGNHIQLRRQMIQLQLRTYDNLRQVVSQQLDGTGIWSPVVDSKRFNQVDYIASLLHPTFGTEASAVAADFVAESKVSTAKKTEDLLRDKVLGHLFSSLRLSVALFRSMSDRLVSLRLINIMRASVADCEFAKSYSPCRSAIAGALWHKPITITLTHGERWTIFMPEPDMKEKKTQEALLTACESSFVRLTAQAGYYDLPQVRDIVCEQLMISEASFDEGINELLDEQPAPLTVGLTYEGITGRRKPLVRNRQSIQIFNLIRRA